MNRRTIGSACAASLMWACSQQLPVESEYPSGSVPASAGAAGVGLSGAGAAGITGASAGRGAGAGAAGVAASSGAGHGAGMNAVGSAGVSGQAGSAGGTALGQAAGSGGQAGAAGMAAGAGAGGSGGASGASGASGAAGESMGGRGGGGGKGGAGGKAGSAADGGKGGGGGGGGGSGGQNAKPVGQIPDDPAADGPWPVGVKTVSLALGNGRTPVEIWYPAKPGSQNRNAKVYYNFADWLPPENDIPRNTPTAGFECNCYRDLPIDDEHGPFPVSILVHDTGSFRAASAAQLAHWASRGFIAVAADHPGLTLRDTVAGSGGCSHSGVDEDNDHTRDLPALIKALKEAQGEFAFLSRVLAADKIAISGHGRAGGVHVAESSNQAGVALVMAWQSNLPIPKRDGVKQVLFLAGQSDKVVAYKSVTDAFDKTVKDLHPGTLLGLTRTGHLGATQLCSGRNSEGKDLVAIATQYNVCDGAAARILNEKLWDCPGSPLAMKEQYADEAETTRLINITTTVMLERTLKGLNRDNQLQQLRQNGGVGEFREAK